MRLLPLAAAGLALAAGGCAGPVLSQRLGLAPLTDPGPYRCRLAPYKLDPRLPGPDDAPAAPTATGPSARPAELRTRPPSTPPVRRGTVQLSGRDLAPVHQWLGLPPDGKWIREDRGSLAEGQWILGDTVDIVASREFFTQVLTVNTYTGQVLREDRVDGDDALIILTFMGAAGTEHATSAPRIQLGPGLMITARRTLRLRLAATDDAMRPVRLRIVARGKARRGRHDDIVARGEVLQMRGDLTYDRARRQWIWSAS